MSSHIERTRHALLELGLEDWIPIPEAVDAIEVREVFGHGDRVKSVGEVLASLVRDGRVRLYRGRWDEDPAPVSTAEALQLLVESRWYSFHDTAGNPTEERLYFVNVELCHLACH